jgi:ankyrin repeat protein
MLFETGHVNVNVPRENGRTALYGALEEITLLLLQHGVDSSDGETALHLAARNHEDKVVKILLEHEADIDCEERTGDTPLTNVFRDTIKILPDAGADPNAGSGDQKAIHQAAYCQLRCLFHHMLSIT